jgi:acylphosphatase
MILSDILLALKIPNVYLSMPTIKIIVKGDVQGVFFRATAKTIADGLAIGGTVKNTNEGNVELIVSGSQEKLNQLIEWCKRGPEKAVVEQVDITPLQEMNFQEFTILRRSM